MNKKKHVIGEHGAIGLVTQEGRICAECGKIIEDILEENTSELFGTLDADGFAMDVIALIEDEKK